MKHRSHARLLAFAASLSADTAALGEGLRAGNPIQMAADEFIVDVLADAPKETLDPAGRLRRDQAAAQMLAGLRQAV